MPVRYEVTKESLVKSQFDAVEQSDLVEQVRDRLIKAISTGELAPGEKIVEAELARRMGISRGPIREAARLLQQWGMVTSQARRGFFVRQVTLDELDDLADYRICLESYAARAAVARATAADLVRLRGLYDDVLKAEQRYAQAPLDALDAALDFHRFIVALGGNPRIIEAFENLLVQVRQMAALVNIADESSKTFFGSHLLPIVEAFEGGDAERVGAIVANYLSFSRDAMKSFYQVYLNQT